MVEWVVLKLNDFKHIIVIGCCLCPKPIPEIVALLDLPQSNAKAIIMKWECLGTTSAQPQSYQTT